MPVGSVKLLKTVEKKKKKKEDNKWRATFYINLHRTITFKKIDGDWGSKNVICEQKTMFERYYENVRDKAVKGANDVNRLQIIFE